MSRFVLLAMGLAACRFAPNPPAEAIGDDENEQPLVPDAGVVDAGPDIDAAPPPDAPPGQSITDHVSVADIFLRTTNAPDENTNGANFMTVDGDIVATILIRFDLSSIPTNATVLDAEIRISNAGDPGEQCTFHQMLESWDENTATSNQRAPGMPWAGAGATPPSRGTAVVASITPFLQNATYSLGINTQLVANWVQDPSTNFGLALRTSNNDGSKFWTREQFISSLRPVLRVLHSP